MADRLLVELEASGRVSVGSWLEGGLPETGSPSGLVWPLGEDALEDLRWYLEDYLRVPFGVYEDRGPAVAARLRGWGEEIFSAVLGDGHARETYREMRARQRPIEVLLQSSSADLLGLPWELMRDPARSTPLALELPLNRRLSMEGSPEAVPIPGGKLRVLMVISRPAGAGDVGYRMIARPLLERLEAVRGSVELAVLRPPTLDALAETVAEAARANQPFQVVHFDGHGALAGRPRAGGAPVFREPESVLVFEGPNGGPDPVSAARVAGVLTAARIPVVVLNACQSGAVGKQLEAAVATRLLQGGIASVVAMAYTVYAVAAAEFMAAFYDRLFAGDAVSLAVHAGRNRLFHADLRPSPKGAMPLADWVVPVHYLRHDVSFMGFAGVSPAVRDRSLDAALDNLRQPAEQGVNGGDLDQAGSFVGRDAFFFELESVAGRQHVAVVFGPGGTGKTELAKAFGRWWRDTGGAENPDWIFWHSFQPGVASFGLDGVIGEIGLRVYGPEFMALDADQRKTEVQQLLARHRILLIWDNFETVRSMPDPAGSTPVLEEASCQELKDFLGQVAVEGPSVIIVTSRSSEEWLGGFRRLRVGGLASHEVAEYADDLLAPYPAAQLRRARRTFGELIEWLDGHPLSMRLILPHLDTTEPDALLEGLRGIAPLPMAHDPHGDRTTSLDASISYSYTHLTADTRRLLAAISLFHGVADAEVLANFSSVAGVPARFRVATGEDWYRALAEAAKVGLLTELSIGIYRVHPALPRYLATQWAAEDSIEYAATREAATQALLLGYAVHGQWLNEQLMSGNARLAFAVIDLQRRTMGSLMGYALDHHLWHEAFAIARPLNEYWKSRRLIDEADTWTERIRQATESDDGAPPLLDTQAGDLWLFITGAQAGRQVDSGQPDQAERTYLQILEALRSQPAATLRQDSIEVTYHQLGMVAQRRGKLDEAEVWYRGALATAEERDDRQSMVSHYGELGVTAYLRGRLDDAVGWYSKALALALELGNRPLAARTYHHLGTMAEAQDRLADAESYYAKALATERQLGNDIGISYAYNSLGNVAYFQGRVNDAEDWYTRSLAIKERIKDSSGLATTYHQLGMIAERRERLDEAENWYTRSLRISRELGDRPGVAHTCHQLASVAMKRGRLDDADRWWAESLAIEEEIGNRPSMMKSLAFGSYIAEKRGQFPRALDLAIRGVLLTDDITRRDNLAMVAQLVQLTRQLGIGMLETSWKRITGDPLPPGIREFMD